MEERLCFDLHYASSEGQIDIVQCILKDCQCNARVINFQDRTGSTPLHMASSNGNLVVMELLLSHGANSEARNIPGCTPLIEASKYGKAASMEVLLSHLAHVDAEDVCGATDLLHAIMTRSIGAVEVLLRYGAQVDSKINDQDTPLIEALKNWDADGMADWLYRSYVRGPREPYERPYNPQGETIFELGYKAWRVLLPEPLTEKWGGHRG